MVRPLSTLIISPHVPPPVHTLCPAHEVSQYGQRWKQWGPTECSFSPSLQDLSEHLLSGDLAMAWDQPDKDPSLLQTRDTVLSYMYRHCTFEMHLYVNCTVKACGKKATDFQNVQWRSKLIEGSRKMLPKKIFWILTLWSLPFWASESFWTIWPIPGNDGNCRLWSLSGLQLYYKSSSIYRVRTLFQKQISRNFPELFQNSDWFYQDSKIHSNPLTPKISMSVLLTVCHTFHIFYSS